MRVSVLIRDDAHSLVRYRESIIAGLKKFPLKLIPFYERNGSIPDCDLIWDPGVAGNRPPSKLLQNTVLPVVATVHGASQFAMKWTDQVRDPNKAVHIRRQNQQTLSEWKWFSEKLDAVIAISDFCADEIVSTYGIPRDLISVVYHGVDGECFFPDGRVQAFSNPYFLHVSSYQPLKNIGRIISAYGELEEETRPRLVIVSPGIQETTLIKGVEIIDNSLGSKELADLYRGALAFVFPSLRESFGLPILEAMASGCPVITSFDTGCAEVAGDAALLVDPRSIGDISRAMRNIALDKKLHGSLRSRGLKRASQFNWGLAAQEHQKVFTRVLRCSS